MSQTVPEVSLSPEDTLMFQVNTSYRLGLTARSRLRQVLHTTPDPDESAALELAIGSLTETLDILLAQWPSLAQARSAFQPPSSPPTKQIGKPRGPLSKLWASESPDALGL